MKYICPVCGWVYDEEKEGRPFSELTESWVCPLCGAAKSAFGPEKTAAADKKQEGIPTLPDEDLRRLSAAELSVVCSNLARGCEKQYKAREAELFRKIADYFASASTPAEAVSEEALRELIAADLSEGYPAVRSAASHEGDRGTLRICTWGEKVTAIQRSLLDRYEREGETFLDGMEVWVCTVCGFIYVGEKAPELCPVCKVPAWKFERVEGRSVK